MCGECCENLMLGIFMCFWCGPCCGERVLPHPTTTSPLDPTELRKRSALYHDRRFWRADADHGTEYDVDAAVLKRITSPGLRILQPSSLRRMPGNGLSRLQDAHDHLATSLSKPLTPAQSLAVGRLRTAWAIDKAAMLPDLLIKITDDLDLVLFNHRLSGRIIVTWNSFRNNKDDRFIAGNCSHAERSLLAHIRLNKRIFFEDSKEMIWGTLVHELLHAYFYVAAGAVRETKNDGHPEVFVRAARLLAARLGWNETAILA